MAAKRQAIGVRLYDIVARAVDEGIGYGWRRAHKHTAKPDADAILAELAQAVMNELCEVLDFGPFEGK